MAILIGTDEAGYGPNLGPLVITATVWQVPGDVTHNGLYKTLQNVVTPQPCDNVDSRIWVADSKQLYKPRLAQGLTHLERGVLAALAATDSAATLGPVTSSELWRVTAGKDHKRLARMPWYEDFDDSLPIDATSESVDEAGFELKDGLEQAGVKILAIRSRTICAGDFNTLLEKHGNKSSLLSYVTTELIASQIESAPREPTYVLCDKHGGRNRYAGILQSFFEEFVTVCDESRAESIYRVQADGREIQFRFQAKADNILAAALASMTSKYLRELAMRAFNRFWIDRKSDLKPTAGYPTDARRFKQKIRKVQAGLGITDQQLWRAK